MNIYSYMALAIIAVSMVVILRRRRDLCLVLILSNLAVFFVSLLSMTGIGGGSRVQQDLGFQATDLLDFSQAWTLLTHMFVHADLFHLIFNMLFLFLIGTQLESRVGRQRFLLIYFLGGLLAALTQAFISWTPDSGLSSTVMVGASGAISALMGAMMMLYPKDDIPFFVGPLFLPNVKVWISVGTWFLLQGLLFIGDSGGNVAYAAHIGGFLAGAVIGRATVNVHEGVTIVEGRDWSGLEELATTPELRNALEEIRRADEKDILDAWLAFFQERAVCPSCGGKPRIRGKKVSCGCGWSRRID